jgi:hypothetical protein
MAYPFLPVNPCCTDVVLNSPCGCSSTITNSGCNNNDPCSTNLTASSTIVYDGPKLSCTTAEPCDTLNVILQKIDEIICNLLTQINTLNIQINNITTQIITINGDIINIYNQLSVCCTTTTSTSSSSTTTSTTTIHPCENFSLNNTGVTAVAIIITDCTTQEQEAIILNPGDTNICVVTNSPLTVPGTVVVTPNGPCTPPTSSTTSTTSTSTSSTSSTTTTTTTAIPCECLTFENTDDITHSIGYTNCIGGILIREILGYEVINVCGCCGQADDPSVTITVGADCIDGLCPGISTTTTSTTVAPNCSFTGTANQLPDATTTTTSSSSSTSTTSSTSTSTSSTTTTTTTTGAPNITPGSTEFQATGADCVPENYPATINFVAIPNPNNFTSMFSPPVSWSDIEYVEIVTVTPTAGFAVKYNGVVLTPGTQLVPTGAITWANVMEIVRDTFGCNDLYEVWTVKIKLYAYTELTNTTTFTVGWANHYCENCITTTTTSTTLIPAPQLIGATIAFQANQPSQCSSLYYPFNVDNVPNPFGFSYNISPQGLYSWSQIEYVEIINSSSSSEVSINYDGVPISVGTKLYPASSSTWQDLLTMTRNTFDCTDEGQTWVAKVKLYGYDITNSATFQILFQETTCPNC